MENNKKPFSLRAFAAVMAALTGAGLPVSGLVLHLYSDHRITGGRHVWFTLHAFMGILFLIFSIWHIYLNRRPLLNYLKAGASGLSLFSREARWAVIITSALYAVMLLHSI